jgi:hypothetical protein
VGEEALWISGAVQPEEWRRIILGLEGLGTTIQWWLGDALVYGEKRFGPQAYALAVELTGRNASTLRNYAWVAKAFQLQRRRRDLPWSFHQAVAAQDPERQEELLDMAAQWGWTKRALLAHRDQTSLPSRLPTDYECPRCSYEWSGSPWHQPHQRGVGRGTAHEWWTRRSELVSPREALEALLSDATVVQVANAAGLLVPAESALAALDQFRPEYGCPMCGFEWTGKAKPGESDIQAGTSTGTPTP